MRHSHLLDVTGAAATRMVMLCGSCVSSLPECVAGGVKGNGDDVGFTPSLSQFVSSITSHFSVIKICITFCGKAAPSGLTPLHPHCYNAEAAADNMEQVGGAVFQYL